MDSLTTAIDIPTVFGFIMFFAALMSTRSGRRDAKGTWRSAYGVLVLSVLHIGFLYKFFVSPQTGLLGNFDSEAWAALTAAAIAGIAADDDADAVGLLLVLLGIAQVAMLAGVLNLRTAG